MTIAGLMGCSLLKAKFILYKLRDTFGTVTDELIGMAIQDVRNRNDLRTIKKNGG